MIGAIAGDIIGSIYEHDNLRSKEFELFDPRCVFTDDTVLTVALAEAILTDGDYVALMRDYYRRYPDAGYGSSFHVWARSERPQPYNSWGNGAAMRISSVGFAFGTLEEVLARATQYTEVTHDHPEGLKGARATAAAVFLARTGASREEIREFTRQQTGYDLSRTLDDIRPGYSFNLSCQGTVPEAIIAFLEATSYEDAIRNAISLGGDSDTLACITGGIADAFYGGVPAVIAAKVFEILDDDLAAVTREFVHRYGAAGSVSG
jgi:ADP-ribosylglycohydrolase